MNVIWYSLSTIFCCLYGIFLQKIGDTGISKFSIIAIEKERM